jgi:hypothetical protein
VTVRSLTVQESVLRLWIVQQQKQQEQQQEQQLYSYEVQMPLGDSCFVMLRYVTCPTQQGVGTPLGANERFIRSQREAQL